MIRSIKTFFILWILAVVCLAETYAKPKHVILIRHGEKIPGENHLDLKGFERAAALAYYFSGTPLYNQPPITHVFATALSNADSSLRPIQTCTPTANHYRLPLNIGFQVNQTQEIAKELLTNPKYENATVLICWSHGHIRPIVQALGAPDPGHWNKNIYDQVYVITFDEKGNPSLEKILQKLMYGDRTTFNDSPPPLPKPTKRRVDEND